MNPRINLREIRKRLESRRAELISRRDETWDQQLAISESRDVGDAADDAVRERTLIELHGLTESESHELREIDAAFARIEDGTYGTCTSCGEEIEERRLLALPYTRLCANCAEMQAVETEPGLRPTL